MQNSVNSLLLDIAQYVADDDSASEEICLIKPILHMIV